MSIDDVKDSLGYLRALLAEALPFVQGRTPQPMLTPRSREELRAELACRIEELLSAAGEI